MKNEYILIIRLLKENIDELIAPLDSAQIEFYCQHPVFYTRDK